MLFSSPGTLFSEQSSRPIENWDCAKACELAREIVERHGAKPYAFEFYTLVVHDPIPDSEGGLLEVRGREVSRSGRHFLGGRLVTLDEIEALHDSSKQILVSNMKGNGWPIVVENNNSWKSVQPFRKEDVVVNPATGEILERGDAPAHITYRKRKAAERDRELAAMR